MKKLHIIDGATGDEIPVTPIKDLSREASIELKIQSIENIQQMQKLFTKVDKAYLKILSPRHRTMKNLIEYFYL